MAEPTIILQPTGCSVLAGETGFFSGEATGADWYVWYDLIGGVTGYAGDTGAGSVASLYIDNAQTSDIGEYWFVAGNTGGDSPDSDHVNLDVTYIAPYISQQPTGCSVRAGETGMFQGSATGSTPIWYVWYDLIGGVTGYPGATGTGGPLYIVDAQETGVGDYWFVADNGVYSAESDHVTLDVGATRTWTPVGASTDMNDPANYVGGSGPLTRTDDLVFGASANDIIATAHLSVGTITVNSGLIAARSWSMATFNLTVATGFAWDSAASLTINNNFTMTGDGNIVIEGQKQDTVHADTSSWYIYGTGTIEIDVNLPSGDPSGNMTISHLSCSYPSKKTTLTTDPVYYSLFTIKGTGPVLTMNDGELAGNNLYAFNLIVTDTAVALVYNGTITFDTTYATGMWVYIQAYTDGTTVSVPAMTMPCYLLYLTSLAATSATVQLSGAVEVGGNCKIYTDVGNSLFTFSTQNNALTVTGKLGVGATVANETFVANWGSSVVTYGSFINTDVDADFGDLNHGTQTHNFADASTASTWNGKSWAWGDNAGTTVNLVNGANIAAFNIIDTATITSAGRSFSNVTINAAGKVITLDDDMTIAAGTNFTKTAGTDAIAGGKYIVFEGTSAITLASDISCRINTKVNDQVITWNTGANTWTIPAYVADDIGGTAGHLVSWVSSTPGSQYKTSFPAAVEVSYLDVTDCNNTGTEVTANDGTNGWGGNNDGFLFPEPTIVLQPVNDTVLAGETGAFSGSATGPYPIWFNWYHDGVTGTETGPNFYITNAQTADAGDYWFDAVNEFGETGSDHVTLTVNYIPSIDTQPVNDTVMAGETGVFSGGATGTEPMWFGWIHDGVTGSETGSTLYIPNAQTADAGDYWFYAVNVAGETGSDHATLTVNYVPSIDTQPVNDTVMAGETGVFSGSATGTQPIWYAWIHDGVTGSETGSTLYVPNAQTADAGDYWIEAVNAFGETGSDHATLTVNYVPSISLQPTGCTVLEGETGVFSGGATGTEPIWYAWLKDGVTGTETGPNLYIPNAQDGDQGDYWFYAVNAFGETGSDHVTFTVNYPPEISSQPTGMTVMLGGTGAFSVGVTGDQPINIAWYRRIAGVTGALGDTGLNLYILDVDETDEGYYSCVPQNAYGEVVSNDVVLTVTTTAVITQQPLSQQTLYNGTVDFTVTAVTDPSFSTLYQWKKDGANMAGATGASLQISHIQDSDLVYYMVTITNGLAILNSNSVTITIRSNPLDSPMSDIGMPGMDQHTPRNKNLRNVQMGNPNGDQVDNAAGHRHFGTRSQGLNSNQGGYTTWGTWAPNIQR